MCTTMKEPRINLSIYPQRGFSLLEVVVVITVMSLLAAMIYPFARPILHTFKHSKAREEMIAIQIALEQYWRKNASFPSTLRDNEFFGHFIGGGKQTEDVVYDEFGNNQFYDYQLDDSVYPNSVTLTSRGKDGTLSTSDDIVITFTSERIGRIVTRERLQVLSRAAFYYLQAYRDFSAIDESSFSSHFMGLPEEFFYAGWGQTWVVHNSKLRIYSIGPDNVDDTGGDTVTTDLADDDIGW